MRVFCVVDSAETRSYTLDGRWLLIVIGANVGGVLAWKTIISGNLSTSSKDTKKRETQSARFLRFIESLKSNVKILVVCMFFAVALPYLRSLDYPMTIEGWSYSSDFLKNKFFSAVEIFVAFVAFSVIYEIVSVVVSVLKNMMIIQDRED